MSPLRNFPARRAVQRTLLAGTLGLLLSTPLAQAEDTAARQYEDALAAARTGDLDVALARLAQLTRRYPDDKLYLHDYIALLQRAQRNDDALALLPRVDRARAPAYVLEALAAAADASGKHSLADDLYLGVLTRYPGRPESVQGLADALAARSAEGVPAATLTLLRNLPAADRAEVLHRAATVLEARSRYYPALHLTLTALRANPAHTSAQALRIRLAARLGAAHLALQLAHAQPKAVDAAQLDMLERHVAAVDGRWAGMLRGMPRRRVHGTALLDAAITRSDALARSFLEQDARPSDAQLRWLHDRMVLLGARGRAADVDTLHRTFIRRNLPLPVYALAAAADANLSLRRPRSAIALYQQVLREQPDDTAARTGMYYALLEAEESARARAWIDAYAADTAPQGATPSPADKARHWEARVLQARARQYDGEPATAHASLERMREEAPANAEVRAGLASVYRARGWPRRAWDTWRLQLLHDPEDVDAYAESVDPLLDTYRFDQAEAQLGEARRRDPEARSVARAERAWRLHQRPELLLTTTSGRSRDANTPSGDRDLRVDATLYTPPFGERYRAFAHAAYLQGALTAGTTRYRRAGAGLEYRGPDLRLTGEWHAGWRDDDGGAGLRLGARWWIDDVWNIAFDGDTRTVEIPLQARAAGIEAKRATLETEARLHESRAFAATLGVVDFSDGNNRQSAQVSWREGWLTRPRHWLASRVELYTSRNSRDAAPYFNPRSDFSGSLSVTGGWRTFRWYERAFTQELTLTGGRYWQRDFAAGPVWGMEYAHRWDLDERFYLRYGLGRSLHPYDGRQSGRSYLTLDLDWRF